MKYFVQEHSAYNDSEPSHFDLTEAYLEFEHYLEDEKIYIVIYTIFVDPNSLIIAACLDYAFDNFIPQELEEYQVKILSESHPMLASAILNNVNQQYGNGALLQFIDFDDGNLKWFYIRFMGNMQVNSMDDLVERANLGQNAAIVSNEGAELINELSTNKMNTTTSMGKGFWAGLTGQEGAFLPSLQVNINYFPMSQIIKL
jgi:hypothetical protein